MNVTYFHRRPFPGQISIERLFAELRGSMPSDVHCDIHISPFFSKGVISRLANSYFARRQQGDVNHITGDVHYLAGVIDPDRTVLTIHDCVLLERLRGIKKSIGRWAWYSMPVHRCRVVTTVSESTKCELVRHVGCDPQKIRVIHNCVGRAFQPLPKQFNSKNPRILQIGTDANKNLLNVTKALRGLRCHLHIVGIMTTEQRECLVQNAVRFSNSAQLTDEELLGAFQQCDFLVFASKYEGFGLPIIEANAVGRPVITSKIYSMPEVAGGAACLVDPCEVDSIRDGIIRVIEEPSYRDYLVEAGFVNVTRFAADVIANRYAAIYREIAHET